MEELRLIIIEDLKQNYNSKFSFYFVDGKSYSFDELILELENDTSLGKRILYDLIKLTIHNISKTKN